MRYTSTTCWSVLYSIYVYSIVDILHTCTRDGLRFELNETTTSSKNTNLWYKFSFLLNLSLCTYQEGRQFDIDTHKYIYLIHLSHTHWLTTFIRLSLRNQFYLGITIELLFLIATFIEIVEFRGRGFMIKGCNIVRHAHRKWKRREWATVAAAVNWEDITRLIFFMHSKILSPWGSFRLLLRTED